MSSFDPASVRQAVAEFTPRRPQKFQDLLPAKDVIVELRQKRASYRAIAELLTQHCLPTSKTAIAAFCHQVLGEIVRPRKAARTKRPPAPAPNRENGHAPQSETSPSNRQNHDERSNGTETSAIPQPRPAHCPGANAQTSNHMKRLDLILNGKGGVGKSFFAVNFVQFLKDKGIAMSRLIPTTRTRR
jgi:hypothetical protein